MVPTVGLMVALVGFVVALYVFTRMVEMGKETDSTGFRFLCFLTAVVAVFTIFGLLILSSDLIDAGQEVALSILPVVNLAG